MPQSYSNEIPSPTQQHSCECYKKLQAFGIPLFIAEEDDLYSESPRVVPYENAFQLPGPLRINDRVADYPLVEENELFFVFERMAQIFPSLSDFEQNVLSFWVLDVFIEGLWTAQNARMSHAHQKATLLWIAYFFNYIQKQNPSRKDLFQHLKVLLFQAGYSDEIAGESEKQSLGSEGSGSGGEDSSSSRSRSTWNLPLPPELPKSENDSTSFAEEQSTQESEAGEGEKSSTTTEPSEESGSEVNLKHMKIILEILYRIFARLWVFLELQTVFHAMPPVEQVDLPFSLKIPKPLYRPEPSIPTKVEKGGKRPSFSEKSSEEIETERQLRKNDYILPLQVAEESKLYLKQVCGQPTSDRSVLRNREDRTKK